MRLAILACLLLAAGCSTTGGGATLEGSSIDLGIGPHLSGSLGSRPGDRDAQIKVGKDVWWVAGSGAPPPGVILDARGQTGGELPPWQPTPKTTKGNP